MHGETASRTYEMPTRVLGRTGERVSVVGIGGHALGMVSEGPSAIRLVRTAVDEGVTFLDNAWCYHGGRSERIMGQALGDGYRKRVFLMTKNHGRDRRTFERQLEESLQRLRTDHVDLLQFHNVVHESDVTDIVGRGVLDAAMEARSKGKIRFIGFSGHHWPHVLQEMLGRQFPWDTVQCPINFLDAHYRSFARELLPSALKKNIGIIGMKALSGGRILDTGVSVQQAVSYCLCQPVSTLVMGIKELEQLRVLLDIVRNWSPMTGQEIGNLLEKVFPWARDGSLERYKTDPE